MNSHDRIKNIVGDAAPGSVEYFRNAAIVLAASESGHLSSDSRSKLQALSHSRDSSTRDIARRGLSIHS